ncbi:hypothetical protein KUH03_08240 [Sphingobacterium sp. E70]|uniref:hypothetical protein n=1 Tax=Sphingobacterium sp. E70 TaxID=2853439 RepID=UPI00211CA5F2|nr:hypothetical protein [Sphingobacterium sp. E70]ULT26805.1 hypothetical protein KUH03_08240 [Sphingobacterium sp. E70]
MKMAIAIHLILLLIGIALLVTGILSFIGSRRLNAGGYTVEATVVENIPSRESEGARCIRH